MFNSQLVQVIAGLVILYLLMSILVSAINELFAMVLSLRARFLYKAIAKAFHDPQNHSWVDSIYHHPLVSNLSEKSSKLPDYISASTFNLAFTDVINQHYETKTRDTAVASASDRFKQAVNALLEGNVKTMLLSFIRNSNGDPEKIKQNMVVWYDEYMSRVSSWYKKRNQRFVFFIAAFLTVWINVDTIELFKLLWNFSVMSDVIVSGHFQKTDTTILGSMLDHIRWSNLPFAWENGTDVNTSKIVGWLITTVGVTFGAQYWFDILHKFINLKNS